MADKDSQPVDPITDINADTMEVILEVYKNEYDAIHDNVSTFENRSGVLITLAGALLAYVGSNFVIPKKNPWNNHLVVSIEFLSIIAVTLSILALVLVITIRKVSRIKHYPLNHYNSFVYDKREISGVLIDTYAEATTETKAIVEKRAFWFNIGLWLLFAGLLLVTIAKIMSVYIGG